ncbi:MAG TPA: hypothetical protein VFC68_02475 [Treponemataceae bacterium]|nr:hypothetical protein [Treponemataceae bacterium]
MIKNKTKKFLGHTIWFKVFLTILIFVPSITERPYNPVETSDVIASVLSHPLIVEIDFLLPVFKLLLLASMIIPFLIHRDFQKILLVYYGIILIIVGVFQNIAYTETYGYAWLVGNSLGQIVVALYCFYDVFRQKSVLKRQFVNKKRLWLIVPMIIALLLPYEVVDTVIRPSMKTVLYNESGVTYCMITPIVIGIMIIFSKEMYKPLLSAISYLGFLYGLLNMVTWFGIQKENWWMGVLHLPLLVISLYGLIISNKEKAVYS